jgi:hypothetical protein
VKKCLFRLVSIVAPFVALLMLAAPAFAVTTFNPAVKYQAGDFNSGIAKADFDGKNGLDLVVANNGFSSNDGATVLLNNGDGTFGTPINIDVMGTPEPFDVVTGDFNRDGKADFVLANGAGDSISVFFGNGDGSFGAPQDYQAGDGPVSIISADFDGVNGPDLAVANNVSTDASIFLNNGAGAFGTPQTVDAGTGDSTFDVINANFNEDSRPDLVVTNTDTNGLINNVRVLRNTGGGNFAFVADFASGGVSPQGLATGDFNGDGKADFAVSNAESDDVGIFLGNGNFSFSGPTTFVAGNGPISITTGDFTLDGKSDLATSNSISNNVSVLEGNGSGDFAAPQDFPVGNQPFSIINGDFNNDRKDDLATADYGAPGSTRTRNSDTVSVLINDTQPPPPPPPPPPPHPPPPPPPPPPPDPDPSHHHHHKHHLKHCGKLPKAEQRKTCVQHKHGNGNGNGNGHGR